ncbi:MAG: hypothetical protein LBG21_02580 [Campylobacteraceae bacterium]|jgi:hypothetical protein|nr:hypothetical protein [Campylobacteraceae bacterium]
MVSMVTNSNVLSSFNFKIFSLLIDLFLIGCGGRGSFSNEGKDEGESIPTIQYSISFLDNNLDIINSTVKTKGSVNITLIADELNIDVPVYAANSSINVIGNHIYEEYDLVQNINLYTVTGVQEISNQTELNSIRANLNGKYILINDIELDNAGEGFNDKGWEPINGYPYLFRGILNGNNHKIINLWTNKATDFVGLFGYIQNAQIKNLGIKITSELKGHAFVGGIAGYVTNSSIINCYSI